MDDLISRKAVEDAIAETIVNGESLGYAVAYDILFDLPSVTSQSSAEKTNGDLISRQAVLDIISDVMPIYSDNYHYILEEKINELPTIPQTAILQEVIDLVIKGLGITVEKLKEMSTEDLVKFAEPQTALSEIDFIELRHRYGESVEKTVRRMCEKQTAIKHFGAMECPNCGALFYEVPMIETVLEEIKAEIESQISENENSIKAIYQVRAIGLKIALEIIDKHISGKESEEEE